MRWFFLLVSLLLPAAATAAEMVGEVIRHAGKVTIYRQGGVRGEKVTGDRVPIAVGDVIATRADSQAWLLFGDDRVLIKEDSSLRVAGVEKTGVEAGTVLFDIQKRTGARGLQIVSPTATIGIKGTRFAVMNDAGRMSVFLREGRLEIQSVDRAFERYSAARREEFEAMQESMRADFEATREKLRTEFEQSRQAMREGDFDVVNSFDMEAGTAIRIDGHEVRPLEFPGSLEDDFKLLDAFPSREP